ncbi:hypothetical protein EVAR_85606_1 [Eumeta japonica]|uniref:Uncharacterized protein n=1 Tax=Eumeta variegata TaxID=151549 RepID=A0A4C1XQM3_EUMVA|nr:hypothetical protein EVAR_85606_1 [Eumeta japonica]
MKSENEELRRTTTTTDTAHRTRKWKWRRTNHIARRAEREGAERRPGTGCRNVTGPPLGGPMTWSRPPFAEGGLDVIDRCLRVKFKGRGLLYSRGRSMVETRNHSNVKRGI